MASDWNFTDLYIGGDKGAWCGNSRHVKSRNEVLECLAHGLSQGHIIEGERKELS
jgi:hypothetical protein